MQISGNHSSAGHLQWFHDRTAGTLPRMWAVSLPLMAFRLAMLLWALWLASALLKWLSWGWGCFSEGGLWRSTTGEQAQPLPVGETWNPAPYFHLDGSFHHRRDSGSYIA